MPQDKHSSSVGRRTRLEETSKPGAMQKILDEMDAETKSQRRSKGGGQRERDEKEKDKDRERRREDRDRRDDKEPRRDKDKDERDRRDREKSRPDDDRDKRDRDKDRESRHKDDKDRERRHRDDKDKESRHRDDKDKESGHRDDKDKEIRHRDDKDRESRHKDDKDRERRRDDKDRDRRRDDKDRDRHREDKDRDRHREDKDRDKPRDDKDRDRHREEKDRESRHRDDKDRDRHRDDDKDRRDRDRDRGKDDSRDKRDREKDRGSSKHKDDDNRDRRDKDRERRDKDRGEDRHGDKDRDHRRNRDKDQKSTNGKVEEGKAAAAAAGGDDNNGEYNYEDDEFENYDEDFDDFDDDDNDGSEKQEKKKAPGKEEDDDGKRPRQQEQRPPPARRGDDSDRDSGDDDDDDDKRRQQQTRPKAIIDFFGAKRRQANTATASRTQRRWNELSRLIDLDKVSYDLFQLAPLEEYALYMRQYGRTNAHQAAVQTNEDAVDREAATDDIETATRWTQNPPAEMECAGLVGLDGQGDAKDDADEKRRRNKKAAAAAAEAAPPKPPPAKSLQRTLDLVRRVLEEESRPRVPNGRREAAGHLSSGFTPLAQASSRYGPPSRLAFDPRRSANLVTAHASALLLWSAHEPDRPLCVLAAPCSVACVCWTPDSLVCAGLDDGALCLWDPAEAAESHGRYDPDGVSMRGPTYSTAWSQSANHQAGGIVSLVAVGRALHTGGAYQIVSLDPAGRAHAWVASTHPGPADPAGSASDLGLRPGGRVSLMRSSRVELPPGCGAPLCLAGGEAAIVGSADGSLTRLGAGGSGRRHRALGQPQTAGVTALDVSPHQRPGLLLAGYADGHVRLLASSASAAAPLLELQPRPDAIKRIQWSRSRPAVFFSLDLAGRMLVYDLAQKVTGPVSVFAESGVVDFALGEDFHSTGRGSKSDRAVCGLCRAGGEVEVHALAESLSVPDLDEGFRLSQLVDSLCA